MNSIGLWFIFNKGRMLYFRKDEEITVPQFLSPPATGFDITRPVYLGTADSLNCWTAEIVSDDLLPSDFTADFSEYTAGFKNLRELYPVLGSELFSLAGRALQINNWYNSWKYCPTCSMPLADAEDERAKLCKHCEKPYYPVISPAIIVAVTKGDRILLARNNRHQSFKRYSILAGFVEPGESLEETVMREVEEEVGIRVKNIRYFASQSWPFPHSLMLGFTAEHESGEIRVDGIEIGEADWFSVQNMPEIPPHGSISRILIDDFVKNNSAHGGRS